MKGMTLVTSGLLADELVQKAIFHDHLCFQRVGIGCDTEGRDRGSRDIHLRVHDGIILWQST